jgi:tetratricopeptide (TPR) repeat protein
LKVISRQSVIRYQDPARDLPAIGKALGVNAVLEGSFRRRADQYQINVQLINPAKGEQIWAENYERAPTDISGLQRDLATRVAFALKAKLTQPESILLQRRPTENNEAYLLYLQARDIVYAYRRELGDLKRAEDLLEKATALDPSFALAFAKLSEVETILDSWFDPAPGRREKARAAADQAIRLQPDLPETHLALARYYCMDENGSGEADYDKAMRELAIAQRGLPNDPEVYSKIGRLELHFGKYTESTEHFLKAAALDPNNEERWLRLWLNYLLIRNYPAAAQARDRVMALAPEDWEYHVYCAYLQLLWKGDTTALEKVLTRPPSGYGPPGFVTEGRFRIAMLLRQYKEAEQMLLQEPQENFWVSGLSPIPKSFLFGRLYYRSGDEAKARASFEKARPSIEQLVQQRPLEGNWHLVLAEVYAGVGRKEDAIREGKRATELIPEAKVPWDGLDMLGGLAAIYVMVGEPNLALPIIEHSLATPGGMLVEQVRISPVWDGLRGDARFQQLLKKYRAK